MPVTNASRINLFTRRVIGSSDLGDRFLDYLEEGVKRHTKAMTTGEAAAADVGAWWTPVTMADGTGANHIDFGDMYGVDGQGNMISDEAGSTYLDEVPFEDAATTYYVAASTGQVPKAMAVNQADGTAKYDYTDLELCQLDAPTAVVDNGGSITITLGDHLLHASDDFTGRTAIVWLVSPESTSYATAVEAVVIGGAGGDEITTTGVLGQSTVSTTVGDYRVAIMGPIITRSSTVQSLAAHAFIGTIAGGGAPRTFVDSGQTIMTPLGEVSDLFDELLTKGWITVPTGTVNTADITITSTGEVFTGGRLLVSANSQVITWAYTTSDVWITWNPVTKVFEAYDTWDAANQGGRTPYLHFVVDGSGNVVGTVGNLVARRIQEFNEPIVLQVSDNNDHRTAYRTLEAALSRIYSLQQGTDKLKAIIEIVDDITIASALDRAAHYPSNVTFRGLGTKFQHTGFDTSPDDVSGARITFSADASLFEMPAATAITGWTFEGVTFNYTGTSTDDEDAWIKALTNSAAEQRDISGLSFQGCTFIGGSDVGNAFPGIINNIGTDSNAIDNIRFENCIIHTEGAVLWSTSDISLVSFIGCRGSQNATTIPTGNPGGIIQVTGSADKVTLAHNDIDSINAELLAMSEGCSNLYAHDNDFDFDMAADTSAIEVGDWASGSDVNNLRIHNNRFTSNYGAGAAAAAVIYIKPDDSPIGPHGNGIFILGNTIVGDDVTTAALVGILIETGSTADAKCIFIQGNLIVEVGIGVELLETAGSIEQVIISNNIMRVGDIGIDTNGAAQVVVNNNIIQASLVDAIGVTAAGDQHVISGNIVETSSGSPIAVEARTGATSWVVMGNLAPSTTSLYDGPGVTVGMSFLGNFGNGAVDMASANGTCVGNRMGALTWDGTTNSALTGNSVSGAAALTIADGSVSGNVFDSTVTATLDFATFVGNRVTGNADFNDGGTDDQNTLVGNVFDATFDFDGDQCALTGNVFDGTTTIESAASEVALVGNHFDGALALDGDETVLVGNRLTSTIVIDAGADETTIVGNKYTGASLTDNGTNTYSNGNNIA